MGKKPAVTRLATIARPNQMGLVHGGVLYLIETKVSADYREAFPDATAMKLVAYDITKPAAPVRKGEVAVYAPWWIAASGSAIYLATVHESEQKPLRMDLVVIDVSVPLEPKRATTIETANEFVADSKQPVLVTAGPHLLFGSRATSRLEVFDLAAPCAPRPLTEVNLPAKPQQAFGDREGALVTQLGGAVLEVDAATWRVRETKLVGHERVVRAGGYYYAPSRDGGNQLVWYDPNGERLGATKLGPTSTTVTLDAETDQLVTTGDALSVWRLGAAGAPELVAKKQEPEMFAHRMTAHAGLICVPERPDAQATDKRKAFAFSLWTVR